MSEIKAGARFHEPQRWEDTRPDAPHIWRTLGYRRVLWEPGRAAIEWDAEERYCFPAEQGFIVHGGMVATLLDTAMGSAAWTVLEGDEGFLTADLRVEYMRASRPGTLRADGAVVRRTRRVVFCEASLFDGGGELLAASRCTQLVVERRA